MGANSSASFQQVLDAERREIQRRRREVSLGANDADASRDDVPTRTAGLALSGGGVRSACVGLGILQALYRSGLLRHLDYLSTVSGGGYVGSYLSSWLAATKGKVDWRSEADRDRQTAAPGQTPGSGNLPEASVVADGTTLPFYARRNAPQPEAVTRMSNMGEVLRKPFKFLSRHLWGLLIVNGFVLSLVIFLGALAAFLMRLMDIESISRFIGQLGFFDDFRKAFFPASIAFALWLVAFSLSNVFRRRRIQAPPYSTWAYQLFFVTAILGFVSLLSLGNLDTDAFQVRREVGTGTGDFIRWAMNWLGKGLLVLLGAAITPYISLRSIIRSGTAPRWKLESWFFNLAAYALLAGVPLLVFALLAHEDVSQWNANRPDAKQISRSHVRNWPTWCRLFGADPDATEEVRAALAGRGPVKSSPATTAPASSSTWSLRWPDSWQPQLTETFPWVAVSLRTAPWPPQSASPSQVPIDQYLLANSIRYWLSDTELDGFDPVDKDPTSQRPGSHPLEKILHLQRQINYRIRNDWIFQYWLAAAAAPINDTFGENLRARKRLDMWKNRVAMAFNRDVLADPFLFRYLPSAKTPRAIQSRMEDRPARLEKIGEYAARGERLLMRVQTVLHRQRLVDGQRVVPELTEADLVWTPSSFRSSHPRWNGLLLLEEIAEKRRNERRETFRTRDGDDATRDLDDLTLASERHEEVQELLQDVRQNNWDLMRAYGFDVFERDLLYPSTEVFAIVVAEADQWYRLSVLGWSGLAVLVLGSLFSVNSTLLHSYYRDQLAEQWIEPHPKYGRQVPLRELLNCQKGGPLHLLTGTLTLFGKMRSLQHDATGRFTFSRTHVGSSRTGFSPTDEYHRGDYELADAMAISGAAISLTALDNVLVRMLLLLANFRLGQWMSNPAELPGDLARPTPLRLLTDYLIRRPEERSYLFVADGGYVDNTGITPLLQRRCRVIIACDAGQDAAFEFEDLRRVMAEGESQYGVRFSAMDSDDPVPFETVAMPLPESVRFSANPDQLNRARRLMSKNYYVVIKIQYPDDEATRQANLGSDRTGYLIYVKPTLTGKEPADLLHYRNSQPAFPHDPTVEQFFDPLQFQMYRRLGERLGDVVSRECFSLVSDSEPLWNWRPEQIAGGLAPRSGVGRGGQFDAKLKRTLEKLDAPLTHRLVRAAEEGLGHPYWLARIGICVTILENAERQSASDEVRRGMVQVLLAAFDREPEEAVREEICKALAVVGEDDPRAIEFLRKLAENPRSGRWLQELCRQLLLEIAEKHDPSRHRIILP